MICMYEQIWKPLCGLLVAVAEIGRLGIEFEHTAGSAKLCGMIVSAGMQQVADVLQLDIAGGGMWFGRPITALMCTFSSALTN